MCSLPAKCSNHCPTRRALRKLLSTGETWPRALALVMGDGPSKGEGQSCRQPVSCDLPTATPLGITPWAQRLKLDGKLKVFLSTPRRLLSVDERR